MYERTHYIRRIDKLARKVNYEEKISALEAKIEKKHNEIKALKTQLSELKAKKADGDYKELTEYMMANNLTAAEVLAWSISSTLIEIYTHATLESKKKAMMNAIF